MIRPIFLLVAIIFMVGVSHGLGKRKRGYDSHYSEAMLRQASQKAQLFTQVLDHFDSGNKATWKQRYWINDQYFDGSGPVFLMIGGEDEETGAFILYDSLLTQLASEVGALLVNLEHRFYGKSRPTPDASTANLKYLSRDQALEDLISFRNFIHTSRGLSDRNKWVSFGGSYPGDLSAWLRLKYPNSIYAALASSAPIRDRLDYNGYNQILSSSLQRLNPKCASAVGQAMSAVNSLLSSSNGIEQLSEIFNSCEDLTNKFNLYQFYSNLVNIWSDGIQYYPSGNPTLDEVCDQMLDESQGDPIYRLANMVVPDQDSCLPDSFSDEVQEFSQYDWNSVAQDGYYRNWFHQQCFELGMFQTSSLSDSPLSANTPLEYFTNLCKGAFSNFDVNNLQNAIQNNLQNFGGQNYQGTRVVFSNGDIDPWSGPGYTGTPPNPQTKVVYISGTSHCADFYGYQDSNPPQLNNAVAQIKQYLKDFLQQ